jgi:hypothetical protein
MKKDMQPTAILALSDTQVRLLSVYASVPTLPDGSLDYAAWARMVSMSVRDVRTIARGLTDMGAIDQNGELSRVAMGYLTKLAKQRLQ